MSVEPPHDTAAWFVLSNSPEALAVVSFNFALSLGGFVTALALLRLRRRLSHLADLLTQVERDSHRLLRLMPSLLARRRQQTRLTRDRLFLLQQRWQLLQQAIALMLWLARFRQRSVSRRPK
jgi:signal transduction histidine kinase